LHHSYVQNYEEANPATHKGMDLTKLPMAGLYQYFNLDPQTIDFIGHALALHRDDYYLAEPALPTVLKIKLYHDSLMQYEGLTSPYIYPRYGLGELPQVRRGRGGGSGLPHSCATPCTCSLCSCGVPAQHACWRTWLGLLHHNLAGPSRLLPALVFPGPNLLPGPRALPG
jgi:hypothetical protein